MAEHNKTSASIMEDESTDNKAAKEEDMPTSKELLHSEYFDKSEHNKTSTSIMEDESTDNKAAKEEGMPTSKELLHSEYFDKSEYNKPSASIMEDESTDNKAAKEEDMPTSKELLYSEYFDKSDVLEKSVLNLKKTPDFQNVPTSGEYNKPSASITEDESTDNKAAKEEDMPTSKELLYSEYFDKSDVLEKSVLNLKKTPDFQNVPTSGEYNKTSTSITEDESTDNKAGKEEDMPTSKELLYSEYFDKSDVLEKSVLNLKKTPDFQNVPTSGVLSKVKQFVTVMEKAEADLKLKSPDECNIELVDDDKPAIEFSFELYKDDDDDESDNEANDPSLRTSSEDDAFDDEEDCDNSNKIIEIMNNSSSDCNSDGELVSNNKSNYYAKSMDDSDSEDTIDVDNYLRLQQKRLRTGYH